MVVVLYIWNFLIVFWCRIMQVLQLWMVMLVLGFLGCGPIVMLQLLLHLLRSFWTCKNGEGKLVLWIICSIMVLCECTTHLIHEENILLSFQVFQGLGLLFLVVKMVCDWSLLAGRFELIMDFCMRFRVVVAWSKSLYKICNGEFGLTLKNISIKWFLNVCIDR